MEMHNGMRRDKSTVAVEILGTECSSHQYIYVYWGAHLPLKVFFQLHLSPSLLLRIRKEEERFPEGMGKDTNVAAVHKIPWSGPKGRLEAFRISSAEMVKKCGGNGNAKHAWYGGSRAEICGIISHGFRRCRQSDHGEDGFGVHLYPLEFVMDG
ncbi:hypothetical protein RHGRI_025618 [Rhododendron griersonianum]|uniref:Uncharacterized protein n=1 Tax=Rhododendron griersonianum TaxID=479676 RepID=A0AAV6IPY0_9ERIC|nr:hypothetical protein RHGRI_025618 [Rhododendron griersonianum]